MSTQPRTLEVRKLRRTVNDSATPGEGEKVIFTDLSFQVSVGEILFIRGSSGIGKSLLLRAVAQLDPLQDGEILLGGDTVKRLGAPTWRANVLYVPQARVQGLKGTPSELYFKVQSYHSQVARPRGDLPRFVSQLGLAQSVLNQPWTELSGGEAQRVQLAISLSLLPSFLLLDEPTANLDPATVRQVESTIKQCTSFCGVLWITHDAEQPLRVGGKVLELPLGTVSVIGNENIV